LLFVCPILHGNFRRGLNWL